jgi:cell wall-associated NlpC family hydrolase
MRSLPNLSSLILLSSLLLLTGCGGLGWYDDGAEYHYLANRVDLTDSRRVQAILYSQLYEWQGVRYRNGGLSKRGVDCSGFVYLTFGTRLGIRLPRSTGGQASIGRNIRQSSLRPGDLVFFKTGWKVRHVGIYLGNRQFIHASTSNGVMASSLDNRYWSQHYWKSVRIGP